MPSEKSNPCRLPGAALVALLLLFAVMPRIADGQSREVSLEELTRASSDVVVGDVALKRSFWDEGGLRIYTEVSLRVTDRVKGQGAAETVVLVPGGQVGNVLYEVSDMPVFVEGEEVLVFLWRDPEGRNLVTGAAQGKLRIIEDERGARMLEPAAARFFRQEAAGKAAAPAVEGAALENPRVSVEAFVRAVREAGRE